MVPAMWCSLHHLFQNQRRGNIHRHPGVVALSVARRSFDNRIVIGDSRLLRGSRDAIDVGDKRNDRLAAAVRRHPSRGNSSDAMLDLESIFLEDARNVASTSRTPGIPAR